MAPQVRRVGMSLRQIAFPLLAFLICFHVFQILLMPWV